MAPNENGNGKRAWMTIISGAAVLAIGVFGWLLSVAVSSQSRITALEVQHVELRRNMDGLSAELRETRGAIEALRADLRETRGAVDRAGGWRRATQDG